MGRGYKPAVAGAAAAGGAAGAAAADHVNNVENKTPRHLPHLAIYFSVASLLLVKTNSARDDNLRDLLHAFEYDLITL